MSAREAVRVVRRSIRCRAEGRWGGVRERGVRRMHFRVGRVFGLLVLGVGCWMERGMERSWAWRAVSGEGEGLLVVEFG